MKTKTITLFAATALLASASTATMAQVDAGGALEAAGNVSVDAGNANVGAGASTDANANASSNAGGANANAGGSTDANGSANANANGDLNASANAATSADGEVNYGSIISDLRTSSTTAADIEALGADAQITVVTLSELRGNAGENASALDQAVTAQGSVMADLSAAIEGDSELRGQIETALSAEGDYTMDDVVSISTSADGQLILVVDDSE
jgi:hypothetical protein